MKRVVIPELLDSDAGTAAEVRASLGDLRRSNRWFGGIATTRAMVEQVVSATGRRELSLLDVGAGSGDVAQAVARQLRSRGIALKVTLLDRVASHLVAADGARRVAGDGLALPFRESSFDLVGSALFVHHLEPDEVVQFVNEALRVARLAVVINDLRRNSLHLGLVYSGFPLYRSRLTRHDAPASVLRAYTPQEMLGILGRTRAARVELTRHYLCRMGAIAWK